VYDVYLINCHAWLLGVSKRPCLRRSAGRFAVSIILQHVKCYTTHTFFLFLFVYVEAESEENQIGYNALLMSFAFSLLSSKNAVVAAGIQKKMLKLISEWDRTLYYAMLL